MKLILSDNTQIILTKEKALALHDEMKYACREVSVFPVMESILGLMEA